MGLATLNVWIHDNQDTCKISDNTWSVVVTYCNGQVVEWCGHTFVEPAKCGHAEFRLPPGCYIVRGFQVVLTNLKPFRFLFFFTERTIAVVGCDDTACVHLFAPTDRQRLGWPWGDPQLLAENRKLPADKVQKFVAAGNDLVKAMPETAADRAAETLVEQLAEFLKKNPPEGSGAKS